MSTQFNLLVSQKHLKAWLNRKAAGKVTTDNVIALIADPYSLTNQLRALAEKKFEVNIIFADWLTASKKTASLLKSPCSQKMWCRSVALLVDGEVFVKATTWIPLKTLDHQGRQLLFLKQRPLGDLLFRDASLKRSEFQWSDLSVQHNQLQQLTRSSIFYFHGQPLLVSETFTNKALARLAS